MAVDLRQTKYRFGIDHPTYGEQYHFWIAAENTDIFLEDNNSSIFLLRFLLQESGGTALANVTFQFQYNLNGAGWTNITTTSSVVKAVAVAVFTNGQDCTARLSGTGTFVTNNDGCTEDGTSGSTNNDVAASGNTETECGLQIVAADVVAGDVIQFRVTSAETAITYTVTPSVTISGTPLSSGPNSGGTFANYDVTGLQWVDPDHVLASDNSYATCDVTIYNATQGLIVTNFGFAIPTGSIIRWVKVEIEAKAEHSTYDTLNYIYLVKGGVFTGASRFGGVLSTSDAYYTLGIINDLWECSLSAEDVNASTFGVYIVCANSYNSPNSLISIDHVRMTIYYSLATGVPYQPWMQRAPVLAQ